MLCLLSIYVYSRKRATTICLSVLHEHRGSIQVIYNTKTFIFCQFCPIRDTRWINFPGVVSKQWSRGSRRREPAGSSLSTKAEPSRKPQPQRERTFDKRPKPHGAYHSGALVRNETAWLEKQEAELGSVFLPGSKKQSLNHLLNFSYSQYSPRDGHQSERGHSKAGNGGRMLTTRKHKYNKEHFLQAK